MKTLVSDDQPNFLSEADCHEIARRLVRFARGGGDTAVSIVSTWTGNVRWARNRVTTSGEDSDNHIRIARTIKGASSYSAVVVNAVTDEALVAATRRAERLIDLDEEQVDSDLAKRADSPFRIVDEPATHPQLFYDSTYQLDTGHRAEAARQLMHAAATAGMMAAGYLEVSATSFAYITSWGYSRYYQYTWAQYSTTVRDPKGAGSGWAGVDWPDWNKIDGEKLSAIALDKCLRSRNPVAIEPGRYTTILEPQAVCDFIGQLIFSNAISRESNETSPDASFHRSGSLEPPNLGSYPLGLSRLGERVVDDRITISADPMDPELGFPPFSKNVYGLGGGDIYHPVTWIERGVLKNESYDHRYAVKELGQNLGLPNAGAFRMSGGSTTVDEMVATTKRGVLVTRFDRIEGPAGAALLCRGYTRDGVWLIENGAISKPIKNMVFTESVLFALNNVEELGPSQRVFHPLSEGSLFKFYLNPQPVIVPPLKIKDFSFTALSDAI